MFDLVQPLAIAEFAVAGLAALAVIVGLIGRRR